MASKDSTAPQPQVHTIDPDQAQHSTPVSRDTGVDQVTYDDVPTILGAPLSEIKVEDRACALRGAQILAQCLTLEGVEVLFGYPGGANLEIFDVLQEYGLRCIRVEPEQGAAHAAEGFTRATGKVGVCLATSGPGATNLVTGIADANSDSVPIVAITGNVPSHLLGKNAFQTVMRLGTVPPDHPLALHVLGMHGTKYANIAINEADLVLALGVRFGRHLSGLSCNCPRVSRQGGTGCGPEGTARRL
jgi:thiamine pyrophosphate-dependent acetolactate synthase large subunit-like protein